MYQLSYKSCPSVKKYAREHLQIRDESQHFTFIVILSFHLLCAGVKRKHGKHFSKLHCRHCRSYNYPRQEGSPLLLFCKGKWWFCVFVCSTAEAVLQEMDNISSIRQNREVERLRMWTGDTEEVSVVLL